MNESESRRVHGGRQPEALAACTGSIRRLAVSRTRLQQRCQQYDGEKDAGIGTRHYGGTKLRLIETLSY